MKKFGEINSEFKHWQELTGDTTTSLGDWSKARDKAEGKQDRQAAYDPGATDYVNSFIDKMFSPVAALTRPVGEAVGGGLGEAFGRPQLEEKVGDLFADMPRQIVEFAPWFAPVKAVKGASLLNKGAKALTAGSALVRGTAETDSVAGGLISAATLPAMPAAGRFAEKMALGQLAKRSLGKGATAKALAEEGADLLRTGQAPVRRYLAGQAGMLAAGTVSDVASQTAAAGSLVGGLSLLADPDYYILNAIGQLPFMGLDVPRLKAEIAAGQKLHASETAKRAQLFDALVLPELGEVDKTLADTAMKLAELDPASAEYLELKSRWERIAPKVEFEGVGPDGKPQVKKVAITPKVWLATEAYQSNTPAELIALTKAFNESLNVVKQTNDLRTLEVLRLTDRIFGDKPVSAETLQKSFAEFVDNGMGFDEATTRVMQMLKNKVGHLVRLTEGDRILDGLTPDEVARWQKAYPETNTELVGSVHKFFQDTFENLGHTPQYAKAMAQTAARMASAHYNLSDAALVKFPTNVKDQALKARLKETAGFVTYNPETDPVIKMALNATSAAPREVQGYAFLSTLGHELFHLRRKTLERAQATGQLKTTDLFAKQTYDRMSKVLADMRPEDRQRLLQTLHNAIIPREILYSQDGARTDYFSNREQLASLNPEETLADLVEAATVAAASPLKSADPKFSALDEFKDVLDWTPDEVSDFIHGHLRSVQEVVSSIELWYDAYDYDQRKVNLKNRAVEQVSKLAEVPDVPGRRKLVRERLAEADKPVKAFGDEAAALKVTQGRKDIDVILQGLRSLTTYHKNIIDARSQLVQMAEFLRPDSIPEINSTALSALISEARVADGVEFKKVPLNNLTERSQGKREKLSEVYDEVRRSLGLYNQNELGTSLGFQLGGLEKNLGNPSQIARLLAKRGLNVAAEVINHIQDIPAQVTGFRNQMMQPFNTVNKNGNIVSLMMMDKDKVRAKDLETKTALDLVLENDDAHAAFSEIALRQNEAAMRLSPDHPTLKLAVAEGKMKAYEKLSDDMKNQVWHLLSVFRKQNQVAADLLKSTELTKIGIYAAKHLRMNNPHLSSEAALNMMVDVIDMVGLKLDRLKFDPQGVVDEIQSDMVARYGGETQFEQAFTFLTKLMPEYAGLVDRLNQQADYFMTERRVGDWIMVYDRPHSDPELRAHGELETVVEGLADKTAVAKRKKEVEAMPGIQNLRSFNKADNRGQPIPVGKDAFLISLQKFEQKAFNEVLEAMGEEEAQKLKSLYKPMEAVIAKVQKELTANVYKRRELKPGREYVDLFAAGIDYYNSLAYKVTNDYSRAYADYMLGDATMSKHKDLKRQIMDWTDNLTQPNSTEYQKIKNGIFTYFLGFNISSMLIETVQPMITTMPMLIEATGSVRQSKQLLAESYKALGNAYWKTPRAESGRLVFEGDPELTTYFNRAIDEKIMEFGTIEDMIRPDQAQELNIARLRDGKKGLTKAELVKMPLHYYSKYGKEMYSKVSGLNAKASFYMGFKLAKQKGLEGMDAYDYAKTFIRETTFSGGVYNRPFGFHKFGRFQGAAGVLYTLNNFTMATIHMMSRLFKDGIDRDLPPAQRKAAQKAAATMLASQFFLAGAFGMPFAGAAITVLEDLFGSTIRDDVRVGLKSISGDSEIGKYFADVVTRGVPTLLGVDAQSRFGLGSVLGFSEYSGFDLQGFTGASGGVIRNLYHGLGNASKGNYAKAIRDVLPQALKNPLEMARTGGKFVDEKGELLLDPTAAEQLAYVVGFRPKRVSDIRLMQKVSRQASDFANKERRATLVKLTENFERKSPRAIKADIQALMETDPMFKYDTFDDIVSRVVEIQLEKSIPVDPMASGSYASLDERQRFADTMPGFRKRTISEQQKLLLKNQLEQSITGTPKPISKTQMREAQMLDQFLQQNPEFSTQKAKLLLQQRKQREQALSL